MIGLDLIFSYSSAGFSYGSAGGILDLDGWVKQVLFLFLMKRAFSLISI